MIHNRPIYSEQPKSLIDIASDGPKIELNSTPKMQPKKPQNHVKLSEYYLSNLLQDQQLQQKLCHVK